MISESYFPLVIADALQSLPHINSNSLQDLQGNLKDLTEANYLRLVASLERRGFLIPLFVWFDPQTGLPYTLDGNQRLRVIRRRYPEGADLPYVQIDAANKSEAKETILLISSQYGEVTKDGFDEFVVDCDFDEEFVRDITTFGKWLDFEPETEEQEDEKTSEPHPFRLEVFCSSDEQREELYNRLMEDGYACKK